MSASDDEEPQYDEEEEEEYEQDDEQEDLEDYEEDTEYPGVRVARNEEDEEEDEEEEEAEDEEYEEAEDDALSNRASELVSQGQTDEAIQVLKVLTQGLADKLPELPDLSSDKSEDFRNKVLSTFALWIEIMRDGKTKSSGDLADKLSAWQTLFVEDPNLGLLSTESDGEEEEEDDKAIVKEFAELLEDLKQPSKKKQRA